MINPSHTFQILSTVSHCFPHGLGALDYPNCHEKFPVRQRCRSLMDYLKVLKTDAYSFHIGVWGKFCFGEVGSIGD